MPSYTYESRWCFKTIGWKKLKKKDHEKYTTAEMPIYNLTEHIDNYLKTSERLWKYYRDDQIDNIVQSELFKMQI